MMADIWDALYNKYGAMTVWAGDTQRYNSPSYYYRTMEARLHMFDGARANVEGETISALNHYRLVHESPLFILPMIIMDENAGYMYWKHFSSDYKTTTAQAQILHGDLFSVITEAWIEEALNNGELTEMLKSAFNSTGIPLSEESIAEKVSDERWIIRDVTNDNLFVINKEGERLNVYLYGVKTGQPNVKARTPGYIKPVSFVKVFEYVEGARIEGTAPSGSIIEISTDITTNQERTFTYSLETEANGSYEFIVPYSTEGPIAGGTNFDVFASPYKIRAGHLENATLIWDVEKEVRVPEEALMEGKTITVELFA
jgi:hypothetical protein